MVFQVFCSNFLSNCRITSWLSDSETENVQVCITLSSHYTIVSCRVFLVFDFRRKGGPTLCVLFCTEKKRKKTMYVVMAKKHVVVVFSHSYAPSRSACSLALSLSLSLSLSKLIIVRFDIYDLRLGRLWLNLWHWDAFVNPPHFWIIWADNRHRATSSQGKPPWCWNGQIRSKITLIIL